LNKAAETCKKAGIQLCYHNHDFEFEKEDGKYKYDVLLNDTDKNLVEMEVDCILGKIKQELIRQTC